MSCDQCDQRSTSGQLWSMTLLWCGRNKIGPNHENSVPCGSLSHFLVFDRFGRRRGEEGEMVNNIKVSIFSVFNQKKMWVKIQHQKEVLNPVYMAPNKTALTKITKREKFLIFILQRLMKRDGVDVTVSIS